MRIFALGLVGVTASCVQAANWTKVAPTNRALPRDDPPAAFDRAENVVSPIGVSESLDIRPAVLHTNKFYSNILIEGPARSVWTLPYIVTINDETPFGMYISYPKYFSGQFDDDGRLKWYATTAAKDLIITATEVTLSQEALMTGFDKYGLSTTVQFTSEDNPQGSMTTYLVRGMAYATTLYENYTPELSSIHAILSVNGKGASAGNGNHTDPNGRFEIELNDGSTWILYSSDPDMELFYVSTLPNEPNKLRANETMSCTLRATLVPYDSDHADYNDAIALLDEHSAVYPTAGSILAYSRNDDKKQGVYYINWTLAGDTSMILLHYALPHHQDLMKTSMKTSVCLASPTKGQMMLVTGSSWRLIDKSLPDFEWIPPVSAATNALELEWVEYYLEKEIAVTLNNYAGSSVYFGGKNLMAYAQLCLVAEEIGRDDLVEACVDQVESALSEYIAGTNGNPLVIDTIWGGLIGSLGLQEGGEGADFYASFYNDHHFHYSYLLHAAAVLAKLRPAWATADNKNWVETLIRDVNTPSIRDPYFPAFRSFDWFCGHSWARGLLFSYDGKDQESTSEDVNFFYAMTMWAIATENSRLERLGRLQTGMVTRSIQRYFLLKDSNEVHPAEFVRNKVTGIFFESKVDYTTWFGDNVEYIHGIQNIPVTAITEYVRDPQFVREEWDQRLSQVVDAAGGVWKTVLYMSYATVQRHLAFQQMLTSGVDDGLTRTWSLYWATTRPDCDLYCNHDEVDDLVEVPTPTPAPTEATSGYGGAAIIPGTIEAEEYDYGGQGVGYYDTDPGNNGGAFRTNEDVDVKASPNGGHYVGWTNPSEYLRYTVDVTMAADAYDFEFLVATPSGMTGSFRVVAGDSDSTCTEFEADLTGVVEVPSTGGWGDFSTMQVHGGGNYGLSEGSTFLFFCVLSSGFNIDSFTVAASA